MKTKLMVVMLLLAVVCMGSLATATTATGPMGVVFGDDGDLGGGPAEFAPVLHAAVEEPADGPAE